ncbi:MAG: GGDEF domain-containing protein [Lachnospiraceae bacterium]|nr:GGDEF domain-containing protein [Lachnospiraceae bacterium]
MENAKKTNSILLSIIDIAVILAFFVAFILIYINAGEGSGVYDVKKGWNVTVDGDEYRVFEDADLSEISLPEFNGEVRTVIMKNTLFPGNKKGVTLRVYTRLSELDVLVDGETIYSTRDPKADPRRFVGMGYHFIQLPMSHKPQEVEIRVNAVERGAISGLPDVTMTSTHLAYSYFVEENAVGIFISIAVFMFGLVVTIISLLYTGLNPDYFRLFLIGSFSLTAGFWGLCSQKILLLFGVPMHINSTLEFFLLELAFLPLMGYNIKVRESLTREDLMILRGLLLITLIFDLIAGILHFTNLWHYPQTVSIFHVIALADCAAMLFVGVRPLKEMKRTEKVFHVGLVGISIYGLWEVISYFVDTYVEKGSMVLEEFSFPLACMIFIMMMLLSYMAHLYEMVLSQAQEEALTKLAYNDSLTGLYNRARSEVVFKELDENREASYALINYDLNGLKTLNDEFGHTKGDLLITTFGHLLSEVFGEIGESMRMGGDEFITVLKGDAVKKAEECIQTLLQREEEEAKRLDIPVEASYGIAYSSEVYDPRAEQIFRMADERMYEMKRRSKRNRVD